MERHRDRFNEPPPLNSTPWFPDDQRPNFPADNHHYHHNHHHHQHQHQHYHHYNNQYNHQQFEHQPNQHHNFERFPNHQQPNTEQNDASWSNCANGYNSGRKRGFNHSGRGASPEHSCAKLYVATVPRTATEETIRSLFQEHGNVVEVIHPKDKKTGERHGYCFVKYATFEEAGRAITALDSRYTFPGEPTTIKVRFADGEKDRVVGLLPDKLYVGCLNRQASKREVEEIFSHYGHVQDVFIVRDEHREHRGCGFVQFSHRDMAVGAIKGLNGIFTMKGCDQPLIVRFANPKRPRNGEPRGSYGFNSMNLGSHPQDLAMRPMPNGPNFCDPMAGHIPPNASYPMQHFTTNSQPQSVPHWAKPEVGSSHVTHQPYPPVQQAQSQPTTLPLQQIQTPYGSSQSSHQSTSDQKQLPPPTSQDLGKQNSHVPKLETGSSQTTTATSVSPTSQSLETVDPPECDWSEHTCPDGDKYYYNCVTFESQWKKPEEYKLFEKLLQKQEKLQNSAQELDSHSTVPATQQVSQNEEVQLQSCLIPQKLNTQQPLSTLGLDHLQIKSETSPVVDPTCV